MNIQSLSKKPSFSHRKYKAYCALGFTACVFVGLGLCLYFFGFSSGTSNTTIPNSTNNQTQTLSLLAYPVPLNSSDGFSSTGLGWSSLRVGQSANQSYVPIRIVTLTTGLNFPWSMAFLPNQRILVTDKSGPIRLVDMNTGTILGSLANVPAVDATFEGGMFDVALDPNFVVNRQLFVTFVEPGAPMPDGSPTRGISVLRARLRNDDLALENNTVIFRSPKLLTPELFGVRVVPHRNTSLYNGTLLFVTLGARYDPEKPLRLDSYLGKTIRITDQGIPAPGNPQPRDFPGSFGPSGPDYIGALPEIWTMGHRNPQGATLHPSTHQLWTVEHGPQGGDEVNLNLPGGNHGWPNVSYGCPYGVPRGITCRIGNTLGVHRPPLRPPQVYWYPFGIAPGNLAFYGTEERPWKTLVPLSNRSIPEWNGHLLVGAMVGTSIYRLVPDLLDSNKNGAVSGRFTGYERIRTGVHQPRDVKIGPDGLIYLASRYEGQILRLERA